MAYRLLPGSPGSPAQSSSGTYYEKSPRALNCTPKVGHPIQPSGCFYEQTIRRVVQASGGTAVLARWHQLERGRPAAWLGPFFGTDMAGELPSAWRGGPAQVIHAPQRGVQATGSRDNVARGIVTTSDGGPIRYPRARRHWQMGGSVP